MDTTRQLPPPIGMTRSTAPILPPSLPRAAPAVPRREPALVLHRPTPGVRPRRAYRAALFAFAVVSVGGWFALSEYIYG